MVSRSAESRAVADFLAAASSQPAGLLIEGEAGIGKTTLWLAGVSQALEQGFGVLSARAGQAESVMAYAAVADLLRDVCRPISTTSRSCNASRSTACCCVREARALRQISG